MRVVRQREFTYTESFEIFPSAASTGYQNMPIYQRNNLNSVERFLKEQVTLSSKIQPTHLKAPSVCSLKQEQASGVKYLQKSGIVHLLLLCPSIPNLLPRPFETTTSDLVALTTFPHCVAVMAGTCSTFEKVQRQNDFCPFSQQSYSLDQENST